MLAAFKVLLLMIIFCSFIFAFGDKDKDKRLPAVYTLIAATVTAFLTFLFL